MEYKYYFYTNYRYGINGEPLKQNYNTSCFGEIFYASKQIEDVVFEINMYRGDITRNHLLAFSKEDVTYVFEKLSEIIEMPVIEDLDDEKGSGLCLKIDMKGKSYGYIKTVLTICRYFFERTNYQRDFGEIMADSIKYSKEHPEVPFIEVFQLFHYNSRTNDNHTLVSVYENEYPIRIISNTTFIKRMNDKSFLSVYGHRGIFTEFEHNAIKDKHSYLDNLDKIERI